MCLKTAALSRVRRVWLGALLASLAVACDDTPATDASDETPEPTSATDADDSEDAALADNHDAAAGVSAPDAGKRPPTAAGTFYLDADGDGFGSDESRTRDAGAAENGFVGYGGDCLPDDPLSHPGAPDLLGDGKDGNCDGRDSWSCPAGVECQCLSPAETPEPGDCEGVNLAFAQIEDCWRRDDCVRTEPHRITFANRGTQTASAVTMTVRPADAAPISFALGRLPALRASTVLLALDTLDYDVELSSNGEDCDPSNNVQKITVPKVDCK